MYTCTINICLGNPHPARLNLSEAAPLRKRPDDAARQRGRLSRLSKHMRHFTRTLLLRSMGSTILLLGLAVAGSTPMPTSEPTGFVTPPFNVGGNTTSTCIAAPDGAQRTPDGSGHCAASWLYERDREPWVPGATGCFDRANFGCQKCDGDAYPWCEAVDDDGNHTGWCYSEHQSNVHPTDLLICAQVLLLRRGHGRGK